MQRFGTRVMAASLLLAVALVGCSGHDGESGARADLGPRAKCVSADPEGEIILVPGVFEVEGEPRELTGVGLRDDHNLAVVESSTVAFSGQPTAHGIVLDYPPLKNAGIADSYADWDTRQQLPGTVTSEDGMQAMLVAVRLIDPTESGRLTGVTLSYLEAGEERAEEWTEQVLIEPPGDICTVDEVAATREWTR